MKKLIGALVLTGLTATLPALEELSNPTPEYVTQTYQKALDAYKEGKYEDSLALIRHVIKSHMNDYRLRYLAGHNHWRLKNYDSAIIHLRTSVGLKPDQVAPRIDLSLIYLDRGLNQAALNNALAGIESMNNQGSEVPPKLFNISARLFLLAGESTTALEYVRRAKTAYQKTPKDKQFVADRTESILLEGRSQLALGRYEEADLAFKWALELEKSYNPENPYTLNLVGYFYETWAMKSDAKNKAARIAEARKYYDAAKSAANDSVLQNKIAANLRRLDANR